MALKGELASVVCVYVYVLCNCKIFVATQTLAYLGLRPAWTDKCIHTQTRHQQTKSAS